MLLYAVPLLLADATPQAGTSLPETTLPASTTAAPADAASAAAKAAPADASQPAVAGSESPTPAPDAGQDSTAAAPPPVYAPEDDEAPPLIVTARPRAPASDPLQQLNVQSFKAIQSVDKAVVGPVAMAYKNDLPSPVRKGVHNFFSNLEEPVVFVNFLLQLKPGKAVETLGRFTINSTIGVAGLIDVAKKKPFNLPFRRNGFAYSMGYYGIKSGPYFYLPLIGATTLRDVVGRMMDLLLLPTVVGKPFNQLAYAIPADTIKALDDRAEFDEQLRVLRATDDPYSSFRSYYLKKRQAEIDALHGRHPAAEASPADDAADEATDEAAPGTTEPESTATTTTTPDAAPSAAQPPAEGAGTDPVSSAPASDDAPAPAADSAS